MYYIQNENIFLMAIQKIECNSPNYLMFYTEKEYILCNKEKKDGTQVQIYEDRCFDDCLNDKGITCKLEGIFYKEDELKDYVNALERGVIL